MDSISLPFSKVSQVNTNKDQLSDAEVNHLHVKILKMMWPTKNAMLQEQQGYYNYYWQYFYTEEEEHKIGTWVKTVDTVYWNMTKRVVMDEKELLRILVIDETNYKPLKQMLEILVSRKSILRASKIFNGKYYK